MHPVDGEVTPAFLRAPDELTAQPGPGRLWRDGLRLEDVEVTGDAFGSPPPLQQVVEPAVPVDVVIGKIELCNPRRRERDLVLGPVAVDQLVLDDPVDLLVDRVEVAR